MIFYLISILNYINAQLLTPLKNFPQQSLAITKKSYKISRKFCYEISSDFAK
jgi:hypothetical protein